MAITAVPYFHGGDAPRAVPTEAARRLKRIERLSWILDRAIPLGRWRIGLDPLIGLIPGFGDWLGAMLSCYVVYEAARLGIRGAVLTRMAGNILLESTLGAVPVVGDLFDFAWQANTRNIDLLHQHYRPDRAGRSARRVGITVALLACGLAALLGIVAYFAVKAVLALWARYPLHF